MQTPDRQASPLAELVEDFARLLEAEEAILRARDHAALLTLMPRKQQLALALETSFRSIDFGPDYSSCPQDLKARIAHCQHLNRRNGALIEANRSFNTMLLEVLRGQGQRNTQVYGKHGTISSQNAGSTLARA